MTEEILALQHVPNVVRVLPRFERWFEGALIEAAGDEKFEWECSLVQFPTGQQQQGPNGEVMPTFISLIALYVSTPGQVLDTMLMHSSQHQLNAHTEEGIRELVKMIVANLREARRRQPEEMMAAQAAAASNGRQSPGGGLILPGT
jgi:hypothetical protein